MSRGWSWLIVVLVFVGLVVVGLRLTSGVSSPAPSLGAGGVVSTSPASTARPTVAPTPTPGVDAIVRVVFDGDTILARVGGADETVRIIGMDSPEVHKPNTPTECFATEASDAAKALMPKGSRVTLQTDPTQDARDRFGRLLAHVILADGTLFAEKMIRDGYAVQYVYDRVPSIYADRLSAAQRAARSDGVGLWSGQTCDGDPHAPSAAPR